MQPGFAHLNSPTNRQASRFSTPLLLVLQAAVGFGCAPADEPMARPNVLVVSVDTLRADHLGAFGYGRETSPFLDSLAREGVRFERAFAPASWTLPSHMSLFTSSYPHTHRVENEQRSLPEAIPTLATILRDAGYRTTGFVSWVYLSASFGFDQGFDAFHELLPPAVDPDQIAPVVVQQIFRRFITRTTHMLGLPVSCRDEIAVIHGLTGCRLRHRMKRICIGHLVVCRL